MRTVSANLTSGQFSVAFQRSFLSNETGKDSNLTLGDTPIIWSYGDIVGGTPIQHSNGRAGVATFNMQTGEKIDLTSFAYIAKVSIMTFLAAMTFLLY